MPPHKAHIDTAASLVAADAFAALELSTWMLKCAEEMPNRAACAPQKIPLLLPRRSFNRLNRTHLWSV